DAMHTCGDPSPTEDAHITACGVYDIFLCRLSGRIDSQMSRSPSRESAAKPRFQGYAYSAVGHASSNKDPGDLERRVEKYDRPSFRAARASPHPTRKTPPPTMTLVAWTPLRDRCVGTSIACLESASATDFETLFDPLHGDR